MTKADGELTACMPAFEGGVSMPQQVPSGTLRLQRLLPVDMVAGAPGAAAALAVAAARRSLQQ